MCDFEYVILIKFIPNHTNVSITYLKYFRDFFWINCNINIFLILKHEKLNIGYTYFDFH